MKDKMHTCALEELERELDTDLENGISMLPSIRVLNSLARSLSHQKCSEWK